MLWPSRQFELLSKVLPAAATRRWEMFTVNEAKSAVGWGAKCIPSD